MFYSSIYWLSTKWINEVINEYNRIKDNVSFDMFILDMFGHHDFDEMNRIIMRRFHAQRKSSAKKLAKFFEENGYTVNIIDEYELAIKLPFEEKLYYDENHNINGKIIYIDYLGWMEEKVEGPIKYSDLTEYKYSRKVNGIQPDD